MAAGRPNAQRQQGGQDAEGPGHEELLFVATIQAQWIWRSGVEPWGSDRDSHGSSSALQTPGGATGIRICMYMHG